MSISLNGFSWCYWSNRKGKDSTTRSGSASESMKLSSSLSSSKTKESKLSSKKVKKKWRSREERKRMIDKEYDLVLVPSDGVCLSASEESSYDSDWSIGWMEPHAPDFFQSDDEDHADVTKDNSFAVLVPCYRNDCRDFNMEEMEEKAGNQLLNVVNSFPNGFSTERKKFMDQWLASLQKF